MAWQTSAAGHLTLECRFCLSTPPDLCRVRTAAVRQSRGVVGAGYGAALPLTIDRSEAITCSITRVNAFTFAGSASYGG
jgi:hypothetical protein